MDKVDELKNDLSNIILKINADHCDVRYSVYRTSLKLCRLQDIFYLHKVSSSALLSCSRKYSANEEGAYPIVNSEVINFKQLHKLINDILKSSGIQGFPDSAKISKYLTILIFETFKDVQENTVALIAVVMFFLILGKDELQSKYKQLFTLYAGSLGMLSRSRTGLLLAHMVRVTDILGESGSFGKINPAVESCFEGVLGAMISLHHFLQWLFKEPQSIVWLPTMHRLVLAKSSIHNVECATCKMRPIVGLRFQCLKCLDYDSCQTCFLTQQNAIRSHKLHHPRQEYCYPAGNKEKMNAFARTIRNIVTKRYKRKTAPSSYLPIDQNGVDFYQPQNADSSQKKPRDHEDAEQAVHNLDDSADFGDVSLLAAAERQQLEKIVKKLKKENRKISGTVHLLETAKNDKVRSDDDQLVMQNRLDTVTLHNQNLQAELDNLKCVVFADNFMHPDMSRSCRDEPDPPMSASNTSIEYETDVSLLNEEIPLTTSTPRAPKRRRNKKAPKQQLETSSIERALPEENPLHSHSEELGQQLPLQRSPEDQLKEIVERLASAMGDNLNSKLESLSPVLLEVCHAAETVKDELHGLIDQTLLL